MPIDPSIALQVRPPQPINPLADVMQVMQLKQAQQLLPIKIQEAQQSAQEGQMRMQQMQRDASENLAIKQAINDSGGDIEKAIPNILKVAPTKGLAFATAARQQQQEELKATGEKLKNAITSTELGARVLQGVPDAADPQAAYQQSIKVMQALGLDHGQMSPTYDPQQVQQYIQSGLSTKDQLSAQQQKLKDKLEAMGRTKITADGIMQQNPATGAFDIKVGEPEKAGAPTVHQAEDGSFHVISPNGTAVPVTENGQPLTGRSPMESERNPTEASLAMQVAAGKAPDATPAQVQASKNAELALKRLDQSRMQSRPINNFTLPSGSPQNPNAPPQSGGEEFLKTLSPSMAAQVKAIAEGQDGMPPANSRSQAAIQLRDMVYRYDPSFSTQRAQIRKSFTGSGPVATNIRALNTAPVHLDQLQDAADAMQNGSFRPGNALFNSLKTTFGGSTPTNFDGLKAAVSGEMAAALKGNATDIEIKTIKDTIDGSSSPKQLKDIINEDMKVLAAKLNTYHESYQQQVPGDTNYSPILPSARAVFAKHGVNTGPVTQQGANPSNSAPHRIKIGQKMYDYKGSGDTADLKNYTEVK